MAKRIVKVKAGENLSDENINKVISALASETKPISKKEACAVLNIAYNTTRLQAIIEQHQERLKHIKLRKAELRGKAATPQEKAEIVGGYLRGESIAEIAKSLFRSELFCKNLIERLGVPSRKLEDEGWVCESLPDKCVAESFSEGQIVWSAQYHRPAIIEAELDVNYQAEKAGYMDTNYEKKYSSKAYKIYILTKDTSDEYSTSIRVPGFNAFSLAYDLGSLAHLEKEGVDLRGI